MAQVILSPELFADELVKLGRANGNIFHRIPGVEGVHDGQVMVRLKKKRFVILDYSIQPSEADLQAAAENEFIKIPKLAGKAICTKPDCNKIGIPVCLYDSDPSEPDPLYLRYGLCFQCQRNLNEQRRTDKKRPPRTGRDAEPSLLYALGPSKKKFKLDGRTIHLKNDAIIINGAVEGMRHYDGEGYGFREIGSDLLALAQDAAHDTARLVNAAAGNTAAALGEPTDNYATTSANSLLEQVGSSGATPTEDMNALYYKAFQSMNKSIFLLSQWKSSWDATISAADAVADPSLNDAVASAAAVAAAAMAPAPAMMMMMSDGQQDPNPTSMVSLLLAADKSNDADMANAVAQHVQEHVDWQMQHVGHGQGDVDDNDASDGVGDYDDDV